MNRIEDIGCHFKFEPLGGNLYHDTDLLISSGRNCLRYIIRKRNIKKIYLPYFLCESLSEVSLKENASVKYYHIDSSLMPIIEKEELNESTYVYIVNYYGILSEKIMDFVKKYKNVIVDNTHSFFDKENYGVDTIYNYRKYFGVPDGACIISDTLKKSLDVPVGKSLDKVLEMVAREETGEYFHYPTFQDADKHYSNEELAYMSVFTENYLRAVDYERIRTKRIKNFHFLHKDLKDINKFDLQKEELTYMYPLKVENGEIVRKELNINGIYSQMLWPTVLWNESNEEEKNQAINTILLPIDQRYDEKTMEYIVKCLKKIN